MNCTLLVFTLSNEHVYQSTGRPTLVEACLIPCRLPDSWAGCSNSRNCRFVQFGWHSSIVHPSAHPFTHPRHAGCCPFRGPWRTEGKRQHKEGATHTAITHATPSESSESTQRSVAQINVLKNMCKIFCPTPYSAKGKVDVAIRIVLDLHQERISTLSALPFTLKQKSATRARKPLIILMFKYYYCATAQFSAGS